jgi:hypothetical protein
MTKSVTRKTVEDYLAKNAPNLGAYENKTNKIKGVYRLNLGPAHSFRGIGKTWREVLAELATH